ncbi:MAG: PIN domain-containing protein, partial [Geminicoccales bacterium]
MDEEVLLDTCACLWLTRGEPMSRASRQAIRRAQTSHAGVYVSAITAWEVATLVSKGRYRLFVSPQVW